MERSESAGINPGTGNGSASFGGTSVGSDQTSFQNADASRASESTTGSESGGITGRVKSVGSSIKDKASNIPAIIADGLQAGAKALRQNRTPSASTESGSVALTSDSSITAVTDTLASGMQSSADWIRDADIEKLKASVEKQVKEHPARSLLVALGAGYLIGKAFRR